MSVYVGVWAPKYLAHAVYMLHEDTCILDLFHKR